MKYSMTPLIFLGKCDDLFGMGYNNATEVLPLTIQQPLGVEYSPSVFAYEYNFQVK